MKPTSPEQTEMDEMGAEVSAAYRAAADAEPSARIDAAILDAARREAGNRPGRRWQVPAAVAAVVVLGVSLSLRVRDDFGVLPQEEAPGRTGAELAKAVPPSLELRQPQAKPAQPAEKRQSVLQERPSRDRSARADRQSEPRGAQDAPIPEYKSVEPDRAAEQEHAVPPAPAATGEAGAPGGPAREPAPAPAPALEEDAAARQGALADAEQGRRISSLRKEERPAAATAGDRSAEDWVSAVEILLEEGRNDEARAEFARFRKRFPEHAVPASLRGLQREYEMK